MLGSFGLWASSKGMKEVSNLVGLTKEVAEQTIVSDGFIVGTETPFNTDSPSEQSNHNKVRSQVPAAGTSHEYEQPVDITYTMFSFSSFGVFGFTPFNVFGFTPFSVFGFTPFTPFKVFGFTPFNVFNFTPFNVFGFAQFNVFGFSFGVFSFTPVFSVFGFSFSVFSFTPKFSVFGFR